MPQELSPQASQWYIFPVVEVFLPIYSLLWQKLSEFQSYGGLHSFRNTLLSFGDVHPIFLLLPFFFLAKTGRRLSIILSLPHSYCLPVCFCKMHTMFLSNFDKKNLICNLNAYQTRGIYIFGEEAEAVVQKSKNLELKKKGQHRAEDKICDRTQYATKNNKQSLVVCLPHLSYPLCHRPIHHSPCYRIHPGCCHRFI